MMKSLILFIGMGAIIVVNVPKIIVANNLINNVLIEKNETEPYIAQGTENFEEENIDKIINKNDENKDLSKVKITIKEGSISNDKLILEIIDNNETTFSYNDLFTIQKVVNGKIEEIKRKIPFNSFDKDSIKLKKGSINEIMINWNEIYGELSEGNYKLDFVLDNSEHYYLNFIINK